MMTGRLARSIPYRQVPRTILHPQNRNVRCFSHKTEKQNTIISALAILGAGAGGIYGVYQGLAPEPLPSVTSIPGRAVIATIYGGLGAVSGGIGTGILAELAFTPGLNLIIGTIGIAAILTQPKK